MARIVLVDDDEIIAQIVTDTLLHAGHSVHTAFHGDDALDAIEAHSPDLVILDYTLPGRTGREILRELRTKSYASDLPVMMLTSRHGRVHSGIADIDGADDYVTKPFDPEHLVVKVEALLIGRTVSRQVTQSVSINIEPDADQ